VAETVNESVVHTIGDAMNAKVKARRLFGVPVHAVTMAQALEVCHSAVQEQRPMTIGVVNAAKVVNMQRQPLLREAVLAADLTVADGMSVVWASRLLRQPLPERITGIDLFQELLALADRERYSVYLLGAEQAVLEEVARRIHREYPNVRIAGARNGYFSDAQSRQVAEHIRESRPDMLFVAMTPPKKEIFLATWGRLMKVPVCHGVGGSFDVMAGKVKRAPEFWQRTGLEWLYRTLQEPRRLWKRYLVTNSIFIWMVARELAGVVGRRSA
jgi:N-acetylglucosaminyldiphosphoundecaprenol N-acetyl-beta-D-mannosaminyltransferase